MKAFWFGLGIGVGFGILTARQKGSVTRAQLWQRISGERGDAKSNSSEAWQEATAEHRSPNVSGRDDERSSSREANLDKTLADSFPTSDPPSSIPDPASDESPAA